MTQAVSDFPSRNDARLHAGAGDERIVFDLRLPGWDVASRWSLSSGRPTEAWLCRDARCSDPLLVQAGPGGTGAVGEIAVALVEQLDLAPETVVAGMGMAVPHPVLRSPREITAALAAHDRDDPWGRGERAALRWLTGQAETRPACGQRWPEGEQPGPWQVDGEQLLAGARAGGEDDPQRYAGMSGQLRWARLLVGPLQQDRGEWSRWLGRRLRDRTQVPAGKAPQRWCTLGRGSRFGTWQVVDEDGLLGTVCPGNGPHQWVATADGALLSGDVHATVTDAAYEIAVAAYRAGRARSTDVAVDSP